MASELRSQGSPANSVVLRVQNQRENSVSYFWLDYEGKAVRPPPPYPAAPPRRHMHAMPCCLADGCRCPMASFRQAAASTRVSVALALATEHPAGPLGRPLPFVACPICGALVPSLAATYAGHAWRLCDELSGLPVAEYCGTSAVISLLADGSVRVQSTAAANLDAFATPAAAAAAEEGGAAAEGEELGEDYDEEEDGDEEEEEYDEESDDGLPLDAGGVY